MYPSDGLRLRAVRQKSLASLVGFGGYFVTETETKIMEQMKVLKSRRGLIGVKWVYS